MSESLRNDGRIWVPKKQADCAKNPRDIAEEDRDYYLERIYPAFGNLVPRDIASRQAKNMCDEGRGVGPEVEGVRRGVYLDFADAIERLGPPGDRGEVRQPLRHVRPDHGRGPVRRPDAHLPRRALRDGRALGRLRPPVHDPRAVRDGRGQLLRPRRQPARRVRADAGTGRRLLRAVQHHPRLPRRRALRQDRRGPPGRRRGAAVGAVAHRPLHDQQGHPQRRLLPPRARQHHVGVLRHGAHRGRPAQGDRPDPQPARRLLAQRQGARHRRQPQPVPGARRPGRRLPRARRADVHRRPQPSRVLRRPLPRRVADRGGRGAAPRRAVRLRRRLGVGRPGRRPPERSPVLHKEELHLRVRRDEGYAKSYK